MIYHTRRPILYVDDTEEQRYAMRRILENEGHHVVEAGTGAEALEMMGRQPALAVVDVKLPDMNGYDLSRRMKEMDGAMPILQVSASFSNPAIRSKGFSGGADAYIAQPVYPPELVAVVERLLQVSEAEEKLRFLSEIGPKLNATLSLEEVVRTVSAAVVPLIADHCVVFVRGLSARDESIWSADIAVDAVLCAQMEQRSWSSSAELVSSRAIIAPLGMGSPGLGAIAFLLERSREYTGADKALAADLASRAGLALQNCLLFASEQATRTALIQSEKLATAGRLSAAIAHEINNPLEALVNLVFLIQHSPDGTAEIREIATTAMEQIERLAHITRQTLGFYREQSSPVPMDLSLCLRDTVAIYNGRVGEKLIAMEVAADERVCVVGLRGEIQQVISNLLLNALESMELGGRIRAETRVEREDAVLMIADSGVGIRQEVLPKIFEPFFTTKQGTGTGLGLWITKTIVEKHKGSISVASVTEGEDRGTAFVLRFPLYTE